MMNPETGAMRHLAEEAYSVAGCVRARDVNLDVMVGKVHLYIDKFLVRGLCDFCGERHEGTCEENDVCEHGRLLDDYCASCDAEARADALYDAHKEGD